MLTHNIVQQILKLLYSYMTCLYVHIFIFDCGIVCEALYTFKF